MNVKNNKRRRETRERIEKLFVEQLQTKEIDEITVSALCKLAGVNRSTFYDNYLDVYDLADCIRDRLAADVEQLYHGELASKYQADDWLRLFRHIYDNQIFYKTYFKLGYDTHPVDLSTLQAIYRVFPEQHMEYHVEFFKAGFNAIVKKWLQSGCRETPEELAEILRSEYRQRA